ncbi:MAG TPA: signal peptide peptidase SppA [Vicinamibacterales bacterium]
MPARRGVWLVLSLIAVAIVISTAGVLLTSYFATRGTGVPSSTALVLRLGGDIAEVEGAGLIDRFVEGPPTVRSLVRAIRRARTDDRVKALIVQPAARTPFWAKTQEIRDAILDFRQTGKKTIAFLEYGGEQEYFLATACERIALLPTSVLDLKGLAMYEVFLRGTLDKVGVYPDLLHIGDYKTAINTFTEKGFTPAHREMTESLNRDAFDQLVDTIAEARKKSAEELRALIDQGPFLPEEALRTGLVDELAYRDEVEEQAGIEDLEPTDIVDYARAIERGFRLRRGTRMALIYAVGTIAPGESPAGDFAGSESLVKYIEEARDDESIKAIVLRVDSPGGSSIASDVIWRALMLAREQKPLIVSMGDLAASGGYYIAMAGDVIVAQPGTLTGSIGIFSGKMVTEGTLQKIGANVEGVSAGRFADMNSPTRRYSPEERSKIEEQMQAFYDQFVEKVAEARKSTPEKIDAIAQGRVWTGRQAKELGLVDELGGLERAIQIAKERAKIPVGDEVQLVIYPPKPSILQALSHPFGQAEEVRTRAALSLIPAAERRILQQLGASLRLLRQGEPLALMPYVFLN